MQLIPLGAALVLGACLTAIEPQTTGQPQPAQALTRMQTVFPRPQTGLRIEAPGEGNLGFEALLEGFQRATGQTLVVSGETQHLLKNTQLGLMRAVDVAPERVYTVVESLFVEHGLCLAPLHTGEPRLLSLYNAQREGDKARSAALQVPAEDLAAWAEHPAVVLSTIVHLPHSDVRVMSNSLRAMLTDAGTQQIVPVGNTNSLILIGPATHVLGMARYVQAADEQARREQEARERRQAAEREQAEKAGRQDREPDKK